MKNKSIYIYTTIYKFIFEIGYIFFASPIFSYMGLSYEPKFLNVFISYVFFFILLLFVPKNKNKPSHQLTQLLFLTSMVPILSIFWLANKSLRYTFFMFLTYLIMFIIIRFIKPIKVPLLKKETNLFPKISLLIFTISFILLALRILKYGGIDSRTFSFSTVYDLRSEIQYDGIWAYLNNWLGKLFIPFSIVISMIQRKKVLFILSCIMQIVLYLSTGSKATLFAVLLLVSTTYLLESKKWDIGVAKLYSFLIIFSGIFYHFTKNIWLVSLVIVRQFGFPAIISYKYYDFFSINEKLFFSEGFIGRMLGIQSPYDIRAAYIISGSIGNHENTGFLGDAYSNGGFLAMIIMVILLCIIMLFLDSITRYSNKRYQYTALMVYSIIILNDGSLLTLLLTGGLGLLLIILYILASEERYLQKNSRQILD